VVAEKECGWGIAKAVSIGATKTATKDAIPELVVGVSKEAVPGLVADGVSTESATAESWLAKSAAKGAKTAVEDASSGLARRPLPVRMPFVLQEDGYTTATRSAIKAKGLHVYTAGSVSQATIQDGIASRIVEQESVDLAANVLRSLPPQELQSNTAIAQAFRGSFRDSTLFKYHLDASTGLVRVQYVSPGGLAVNAEFNAYSVIRTAALAAGATAPLSAPRRVQITQEKENADLRNR
jgi:hypothetical protein